MRLQVAADLAGSKHTVHRRRPQTRQSRGRGPVAIDAGGPATRSVAQVANYEGRATRRQDTCIVEIAVLKANAVDALAFVPKPAQRPDRRALLLLGKAGVMTMATACSPVPRARSTLARTTTADGIASKVAASTRLLLLARLVGRSRTRDESCIRVRGDTYAPKLLMYHGWIARNV